MNDFRGLIESGSIKGLVYPANCRFNLNLIFSVQSRRTFASKIFKTAKLIWVIIICGLFFLAVGSLVYHKSRHNEPIEKGFFGNRYETLQKLIRDNRRVTSEKYASKTLTLKVVDDEDVNTYALTEVDDRLIVVWTLNSVSYGKRGKEWSFSNAYSQERMYEEITSDINRYKKLLYRES